MPARSDAETHDRTSASLCGELIQSHAARWYDAPAATRAMISRCTVLVTRKRESVRKADGTAEGRPAHATLAGRSMGKSDRPSAKARSEYSGSATRARAYLRQTDSESSESRADAEQRVLSDSVCGAA
jgi:hypothetical protein